MSFFSPAPSMIVVFSLSMRMRLALPSSGQRDALELDAEILGDDLAARQDGDVLELRLAAIAEARRLHGGDLQAAAQLVDDERGQSLALDVLGDDEQRLAGLHHGLEDRQQRLQRRQLLLVDEDVGVLELGDETLGVGDEVGREIAAVELQALDDDGLGVEALGLFHRDHALIADLLHRLGDLLADVAVAIGRDGADLGDLVVGGDLLGVLLQIGDHRLDREVDAALEILRVEAGRDGLGAFAGDGGGEDGRRRGAVAGGVVLLGGDLTHELRAEILELVGELDLLGDGDAVLGDARSAEALLDDDVAALGAERDLHRIGEDFDAAQNTVARVGGKANVLGCHCRSAPLEEGLGEGRPDQAMTPRMSLSFMMRRSSPSILTSVPDHLPNSTRSPSLTSRANELAALVAGAGADGDDLALGGLLFRGVGNDDAAFGLVFAFEALDHDPVVEGTERHVVFLRCGAAGRSARAKDCVKCLLALRGDECQQASR